MKLLLIAITFALSLSAWGQSPAGTGAIHGTVKDNTGGIIPGASLTLTYENGESWTAETDAKGSFQFLHLPAGTCNVVATYAGLQQTQVLMIAVTPGETFAANIVMMVKSQKQEVTVSDTGINQISTEPANNASALVLKQEDLDALPDDPDDLASDLQALAGPSAGPGGSQIFIDGFTGGRLPPKSSIREIRINSNPFSAEYDKMGFGRIEIFTKPGTDKFHGQGYFGMSDGIWNSRNPFLATAPPFKTELFGGNVSGPLGKKGSFFIDLDRRNIDDNGIINATIPSANFLTGQPFQSYYATPQRRTTVSPRVDFQLSPNNTLSMRYSYLSNDELVTGIGSYNLPALTVGNVTLPSSGYKSDTNEHLFQLVDTAVINPRVINEIHFQFARDAVSEASQSSSPQLNVANSFVAGGSGYSATGYGNSYDIQNQYELQNYTSVTAGAHLVKFGFRIRADAISDYAAKNFNGTYTFLGNSAGLSSLDQYLITERLLSAGYTSQQVTAMGYGPSQYSLNSGKPYIGLSQIDAGPFVQDDWRLKPNFTLSLGLRWESQTNIPDKNDWAPRVGFAWSPDAKASGGRAKTVIRGGWGIFYDRFQAASVLNAYRYNGENQTAYLLSNPTTYNSGFTIAPALSDLQLSNAEQRYQIDSHLHAPMLMQTVIGVERQLFNRTTLSFNFVNSRGVHELRTVDINAPLPGTYIYDATGSGTVSNDSGIRPYGNIGDIYDYQSTGTYKQTQLMVGLNTTILKRLTLFSRYVYGDAHSDTDGLTTFPSNPYNFSGDWGRSSLDIKNMLFVSGSASLPFGLRLSPFFIARSGAPFNITTGTDLYGTGQIASTARPSIVSAAGVNIIDTPFGYLDTVPTAGQTILARNAGTGPGFIELNLRLSKTWGFGTTKFEGMSGGATARQGGGPPGGGGPGGGGHGGPGGGSPPPGGGGPGGGFSESSGHRYNLTLSIMARNILNHENLSAPVGVVTSPYFLESTSIAGGFGPQSMSSDQRRIDLQLRFSF
ncbi:MAG TPA: carboxypeptidase regulatory-like domain-containing protein [Bryobacteraceae bacterium]